MSETLDRAAIKNLEVKEKEVDQKQLERDAERYQSTLTSIQAISDLGSKDQSNEQQYARASLPAALAAIDGIGSGNPNHVPLRVQEAAVAKEESYNQTKDAIMSNNHPSTEIINPAEKANTLKDMIANAPAAIKKVLSKLADFFAKLANNTDTGVKAETAKIDSSDNKKIFDKYGIKTDKNVLDFGKATVDRKSRNANQDSVDLRDEKLKDGKLTIDPNTTKSVTTKEDNGKVVVTITDNNGASNIYTVSNLSTTQAVLDGSGNPMTIGTAKDPQKSGKIEV